MKQHLNYCRQMALQFQRVISALGCNPQSKAILSHAIDLANASQKFLLPPGGRLYDDPEFRALDETKEIHLPFPFIAIEYQHNGYTDKDSQTFNNGSLVKSSKRIILARERDDSIAIMPICFGDNDGLWGPFPEVAIPKTNFLDRKSIVGGRVAIRVYAQSKDFPLSDYDDELGALLCFLNVLECPNVHFEKSKKNKEGKKIKSALPFDDYHILTVDIGKTKNNPNYKESNSANRSPREHIRRGHIRRYESGLKIWVNAAVVNGGKGVFKAEKDYRFKNSAINI